MHPLWAESMEDLEGNPMVEAFRLLREEDKTKVELVLMYKDEGNEFMRKKTKKERHEAIKRYSHALTLLDAADAARRDGTEDEADRSVNLRHLRALIFNNRAMALMQLKNNGLALKDLTMVHSPLAPSLSLSLCPSLASPPVLSPSRLCSIIQRISRLTTGRVVCCFS
jgi:hypothetical protein